jgi:hypothetical protein
MDLKSFKEQANKAGFSEGALASLNSIIDAAITKGSLSDEDSQKILEIINKEAEQAKTQASVMEEIAFELESYASELDQTAKIADEKIESLEKDFDSDMDDLEEEFKQTPASGNPPTV